MVNNTLRINIVQQWIHHDLADIVMSVIAGELQLHPLFLNCMSGYHENVLPLDLKNRTSEISDYAQIFPGQNIF